jgi:membrane fusion protein (multidrug efflux system)
VYGKKTVYHGKIEGLGAGTGAAFALLPAQNATGNWIKVVQRLAVRISLDAEQLRRHPLRIGLSMQAEVEIRDASGAQLASAPRIGAAYATQAFAAPATEAEARVRAIIAAHR